MMIMIILFVNEMMVAWFVGLASTTLMGQPKSYKSAL